MMMMESWYNILIPGLFHNISKNTVFQGIAVIGKYEGDI